MGCVPGGRRAANHVCEGFFGLGPVCGTAFTLGGGLSFYVKEGFALDAALAFSSSEFNTIKVGGVSVEGFDFDATSTRFNLGFVWWP